MYRMGMLCGGVQLKGVFTMSFLDDVINTTKNVAVTAGKKTDVAVQFSKLKIKEAQLNGDIKNKFEKLGALIYQMAKTDDKDNKDFDALVSEIDECYARLAEIDEKLDEYKKEVTCPDCGAKTKRENSYCPKCGKKLPERPVEQEEPEKTEEESEASSEEKKDED